MANKLLHPVFGLVRLIVDAAFSVKRLYRKKSTRLYIYTDSRGFRVEKWYCKKNPIGSYIEKLSERYHVSYVICPESHTTIFDFLHHMKKRWSSYDFVVLHAGVVDFSPRPLSQAMRVLREKRDKIIDIFGRDAYVNLEPMVYGTSYEGEVTASLYSVKYLESFILPEIKKYSEKIIWIGVNPVLESWTGNYKKKRPRNMNEILRYQEIIEQVDGLNCVSLSLLTPGEVKHYTVDNVHLSDEGFKYLFHQLLTIVEASQKNRL